MLKVNFRCHTPKKRTFWEVENLPFFENISFAGLKSKFLSTQQKLYMSPTHPINMSSIGLKLMKLEQSTFYRFFFPLTVEKNEILKKLAKFDKIIQRMNPVFSAINTYHLGVLFPIFPLVTNTSFISKIRHLELPWNPQNTLKITFCWIFT